MRLHHLAPIASAVLVAGAVACTAGSTTTSPIPGPDSGAGGGGGGGGGGGQDSGGGGGGGGGGSTVVSVDGLSKTCSVDTDCIPVYVGDVCGFCNISNASIAKSAQMDYQDAYSAARASCPPSMGGGSCVQDSGITVCSAQKTCQLVMCASHPADAHHCADGG